MSTNTLIKQKESLPSFMDEFFKPWNEWFSSPYIGKELTVPAVNIVENADHFTITVAVPGMKKDDFDIQMEGNMLTISCEKEERKEDKHEKYTRKEYNYSSFSRSFTMPEHVNQGKIEANYENGLLKLMLPKKDAAKKQAVSKHIPVK